LNFFKEDAVTDLMFAMTDGSTLAWAVEHASDGRNPLPDLWAITEDALAMHKLIVAGLPESVSIVVTSALIYHWDTSLLLYDFHKIAVHDKCQQGRCCSDLIRSIVPVPPSLASLLAVRI
jgi:hypothetical protein